MKKLIVAVIIMFIGTTSFSQGIDIDLGIKAGINFSNMRRVDALNLEYKKGLQAGVFVGVNFSEKIGVQADLLYSEEGAEFSGKSQGKFDLTYINLPIVFKYYLVEGEGLSLQIGPQFGYLLESELRAFYNGEEIQTKGNDFNLSGVIGLGYDLPAGFHIDGRMHYGFTDVSEVAPARLKAISLALGYSFF